MRYTVNIYRRVLYLTKSCKIPPNYRSPAFGSGRLARRRKSKSRLVHVCTVHTLIDLLLNYRISMLYKRYCLVLLYNLEKYVKRYVTEANRIFSPQSRSPPVRNKRNKRGRQSSWSPPASRSPSRSRSGPRQRRLNRKDRSISPLLPVRI